MVVCSENVELIKLYKKIPHTTCIDINQNKNDNELSNLGTYCLGCYTKYIRPRPLNPYSKVNHNKQISFWPKWTIER